MAIDLNHYKSKLEEQKQILEAELKARGRQNPENPSDWEVAPERIETDTEFKDEVADELEEMEERQATELELEARYKQINHALGLIAAGKYGICEVGGEEIEAERLEANPAARTCKAHIEQEDDLPLH